MTKYYLCRECGKIYDGDLIKYPYCPDLECNSCDIELIELDELMLYPIKVLNEKGYITSFCCSGHAFNNIFQTYICFDSIYKPNGCPKNWKREEDDYCERLCLRAKGLNYKEWNNATEPERQKIIFKRMLDLYDWVDKLPYCDID